MTALGDLDRARIGELYAQELARFRADRPRSLAMISRARAHMPNGVPMAWMASEYDQPVYIDRGRGAGFTDLDGFSYVDFNVSDMSMFCGHANPAIVAAVQAQAARSTQFLLQLLPDQPPLRHWWHGDELLTLTGHNQADAVTQRTTGWLRYELLRDGELVRTELQLFILQWYGLGEFTAMLREAGFQQVTVHADYQAGQLPADGGRAWTFEATRD